MNQGFVDAMLIRLSTSAGLTQLVTGQERLRALFSQVYDLPFAVIQSLRADVAGIQCQRPLFSTERRTGSWLRTVPAQSNGDFQLEGARLGQPYWIDVSAELLVTADLLVDGGAGESLRMSDLGEFDTLEEFRALVPDLDLDAFLAEHGITTVEELRERFRYSGATVRFKPAPPPGPGNMTTQQFPLPLALLVRETIDLAAILRDVQLVRLAADQAAAAPPRPPAERRTASAHALVLPAAAVAETGLDQEDLITFFAGQQVLAIFEQD